MNDREVIREAIRAWSDQPECDKLASHEEEELTDKITADLPKLHTHWLEQLKEELEASKEVRMLRYAAESIELTHPGFAESLCGLADKLAALASIPIEEGGDEYPTVEVAFSPTYGMPHFIASTRAEDGDYLYELGDEGWRLTMLPDMRIGSGPVHPDVEDALWRGAGCLTGEPDLETVFAPIIPGGVLGGASDE